MKPQDESSAKGAPILTVFDLVNTRVFCISFIYIRLFQFTVFMAFSAPACSYIGKVPNYFFI